ncbi:hypothetical protein AAFC00_006252 [Neodothiora populina]|uniref:Enoyl reductase (ER) domain-containing protein n=1 Tax=Neodothiora populina TaxID=2781224 RepID=A0ABR3P4I8_9PEZI
MASPLRMTGKAIVARDTLPNGGWKMETVTTRPIKSNELLVEMVASGICHTDVVFGSMPANPPMAYYPRILGHEGSGYVKAVGDKVTVAKPGDAVLLSFDHCKTCATCQNDTPSLCYEFNERNFGESPCFTSETVDGNDTQAESEMSGRFFGQSSFAKYSVVSDHSVVNATNIIKSKEELQLFSPLGCGIQTGSGTVINVAKAQPKDVIAIQGLGGVGLAAIMAAKIAGCRKIIGIDMVESRLQAAKEFGATDVVDTSKLPAGKTIIDVMRELGDGVGPSITIETTGVPFLIKNAVEQTRMGGRIVQVGTAPPDFALELPVFNFMVGGKILMGAVEGNSKPDQYIPQMIQWWREGKFPFDKLCKLMPADDFLQGLAEMKTGETVKPILTW